MISLLVFVVIAIVIISYAIFEFVLGAKGEDEERYQLGLDNYKTESQPRMLGSSPTKHDIDLSTLQSTWAQAKKPPNTQISATQEDGFCVEMIRSEEGAQDDGSRIKFMWHDGYWSCEVTPPNDRVAYPHLLQWCRAHEIIDKLRGQLPILNSNANPIVIEFGYGLLKMQFWQRIPCAYRDMQQSLNAMKNIYMSWPLPLSRRDAETRLIELLITTPYSERMGRLYDTLLMDCQTQLDHQMVEALCATIEANPDKRWGLNRIYTLCPVLLTDKLRAHVFEHMSPDKTTHTKKLHDAIEKNPQSQTALHLLRTGLSMEKLDGCWFDDPTMTQALLDTFIDQDMAEHFAISTEYCAKIIDRLALTTQALTQLQRTSHDGQMPIDDRLLYLMLHAHKDLPPHQAWPLWMKLMQAYQSSTRIIDEIFKQIMHLPYMYQTGFFDGLWQQAQSAAAGYTRSVWNQAIAKLPQEQLEMLPPHRQQEYFDVLLRFAQSDDMTEQYVNIFLLLASRQKTALLAQQHHLAPEACVTKFCQHIADRQPDKRLWWAQHCLSLYQSHPHGVLGRYASARRHMLRYFLQHVQDRQTLWPLALALPAADFPNEHFNDLINWLGSHDSGASEGVVKAHLDHLVAAITSQTLMNSNSTRALEHWLITYGPLHIITTLKDHINSPTPGPNLALAQGIVTAIESRYGRMGGGLSVIDGAADARGGLSVSHEQGERGALSHAEQDQ